MIRVRVRKIYIEKIPFITAKSNHKKMPTIPQSAGSLTSYIYKCILCCIFFHRKQQKYPLISSFILTTYDAYSQTNNSRLYFAQVSWNWALWHFTKNLLIPLCSLSLFRFLFFFCLLCMCVPTSNFELANQKGNKVNIENFLSFLCFNAFYMSKRQTFTYLYYWHLWTYINEFSF